MDSYRMALGTRVDTPYEQVRLGSQEISMVEADSTFWVTAGSAAALGRFSTCMHG